MMKLVNLRYDVLRTVRNRRFFALTLALPLVLFYSVASANKNARTEGISFPLYFMTGMAVYGALFAVMSPGARIAFDRSRGWSRQLRITPLRPDTYLGSKVVTAYVVAIPSLLLVFLAGASLGVHLSITEWLEMTGLILVGLAPFILMGILLGHLVTVDSLAPAVGGLIVIFALFGGAYGSLFNTGIMLTLVKLLPSFWMVRAGKAALVLGGWPAEGWIVVAVWTALIAPLALLAYRRDTARV
jgi:ABC-2 type transport system permease protein